MQQILRYPHTNLTIKTNQIETFDESVKTLETDLLETAKVHNAEGLAANQIGSRLSALVIRTGNDEEGKPVYTFMANPRIVMSSGADTKSKEGCLSFPNIFEMISRPPEVLVHFQTVDGESKALTLTGEQAVSAQHEIDHLNGLTFLDRMGKMQRRLVEKKLVKIQREHKHRLDNLKKQLGITLSGNSVNGTVID